MSDNPYLLEIDFVKLQGEVEKLQQQRETTYKLIINANSKIGRISHNDKKSIKVAQKELLELEKLYKDIVELETKKVKELKILKKDLNVSVSLTTDNNDLFDYLQEVDESSIVKAHAELNEKMKHLKAEEIAIKRITDVADEVIKYENSIRKKSKKRKRKAELKLKLASMSAEDRLLYAKNERKQFFKKVAIGGGVAGVGSMFFIPVLATPFIFIGTFGALSFSGYKVAEKIGLIKKEDFALLTQMVQEYAYAPKQIAPPQPQSQQSQKDMMFGGY